MALVDDKGSNTNTNTVESIACRVPIGVFFTSHLWYTLHQQRCWTATRCGIEVAKVLTCTLRLAQAGTTFTEEMECMCIREKGRAG